MLELDLVLELEPELEFEPVLQLEAVTEPELLALPGLVVEATSFQALVSSLQTRPVLRPPALVRA